jgi:hypothetical protein
VEDLRRRLSCRKHCLEIDGAQGTSKRWRHEKFQLAEPTNLPKIGTTIAAQIASGIAIRIVTRTANRIAQE